MYLLFFKNINTKHIWSSDYRKRLKIEKRGSLYTKLRWIRIMGLKKMKDYDLFVVFKNINTTHFVQRLISVK